MLKKLAVSDYDGTMYHHEGDKLPEINIEGIKKWRAAGHGFAFCTGRNILSLLFEIKRYNLEYDYILCNSGAIIMDNQRKIIYEAQLSEEVMEHLINTIDYPACRELMLSTSNSLEALIIDEPNSKLVKYFEGETYKAETNMIRHYKPEEFPRQGVTQFTIAMASEELAKAYAMELETKFADKVQINHNLSYIDICAPNIDKATGIAKLIELQPQWDAAQVLTIGDAQNDLPMLTAYEGYSLDSATEDAKGIARKLYPTVGDMLLDNI